ncbi:MAG: D-alanyl-D-alanine carboxypeptidase/D-alanyl-D-alanine-endopeptidase, partial [Prevotella sp.]|nr:D-alanyl-D-alanine carboxypeptidase/D-alanyl-D-alanine-endopeptidase [Prevotella sp.]
MKSKICYTLIFILLAHCTLIAQTKQKAIQNFLNNEGLKNASAGICIKDFSGKRIASHNPDRSYTPASILKVVTTATALEILGSGYRYQTTLEKDINHPGRLLIRGYGDPTLGTEHLDNEPNAFLSQWAGEIEKNIDSDETLDIMVIDDYFGYGDGISHRWIYQDMGNYYAAAAYGVSVFDNTYKLYFNTTRSDTCPVIVKTEPEININFKNTLKINSSGQDNGYIHGAPFSMDRLLTGSVPGGKTSFSIKGDIPDPGMFLAESMGRTLAEKGYKIGKAETSQNDYYGQMYLKNKKFAEGEIFYNHRSFPLKDIIKDTNVRSNNHYAEHLIRTVGRTETNDIYSSALDAGIKKTNDFWKNKGLDTDALTIFDGSGLSPADAVSPAFMCDLLVYMQTKSKYAPEFLESLPQAGMDGTVRNRLAGTRLAGKIRMKSGSIYGVQCFAGYYINGDTKYAFTIMVNKFS